MRNIIIVSLLFVSLFASAQSRVGLVHPRVLGQATDTSNYGVLLMDTTNNSGQWFTLNTTDFQVSGGELGLRFQTDSVFTMGDSLCAITNGDTLCVFQDSVYITNDSFCIIQMGDTTCVQFSGGGLGTTLYTGDDTITSNRILTVPTATTMLFRRTDSAGTSDVFKIESSAGLNSLTLGLNSTATNRPVVSLRNTNGSGNIYQEFENTLSNFNIGIDRATGLFNITEGGFIHTGQFMQFSSAGDSITVNKDIQIDAGLLDGGGDIGSSGQVLTSTGTGVNWETPTTSGIAISDLTPATATNTINNDAWKQEWQWDGLAGSTGLKLSAATTAAIGSTQKLFEVSLSEANGTSGQSTYAGHFSNTHTGSSSTNYGVYSVSTGGTTNYGLYGAATTGAGVYGISSSSGNGGVFASSSGPATVMSTTTGSYVCGMLANPPSTNTVIPMLLLARTTSGTAAPGIGGYIQLGAENGSGTSVAATRLSSYLTAVTAGAEKSTLSIIGLYNGTQPDIVFFSGDKSTAFNGRSQYKQGADVASAAGAIALGYDGNTFEITGTNAITLISNLGWQNGSEITLLFTSTASLTDGVANSGTDIGMELAGNANFTGSADDSITLVLSEIGGTQRFREKSRSIN